MNQSVYNHVSDGILIVEDGFIQFINDKSCQLLGLTSKDVLGECFETVFQNTSLLYLDDFQERREIRGDKVFTIKKVPKPSSGKCNFLIILQDITLLEELGYYVHEHSADLGGWLLNIFNSASDGLSVMDNQGVVVRINPAHEEILGARHSEVVSKHVNILKRERIINQSVTLKVLANREPVTIHHITRTKSQVLSTGVPIFDERGNIVFVACVSRDMALLKAQEIICTSTRYPKRSSHNSMAEDSEIIRKLSQREYVFKSPKMKEILSIISEVTKSESTVLLHGETGVGKEVIAKLIHELGPRGHRPFIPVNCPAIPRELIESELFGYEPGAFTGARKEGKKGLIETADMGTLFLDEIAELDQPMQSKLLRMLQEHTIQRVGGLSPIKINVRVISATNHNLKDMVKNGQFREDLFYRLSVIPIHIPSLRERQEDIAELILQNLEKFNNQYKKNVSFTKGAISLLTIYQWPGNIRELINTVERCVVLAKDPLVKPRDLNIEFSFEQEQGMKTLNEILDKTEKDHLLKAISIYGSTHKVAKVLGVSQPTVVRKIKKHFHKTFPSPN